MGKIKCVIWDLDNTLWDGILQESEIDSLLPERVNIIKTLDERGIIQSIASKNDHDLAISQLKKFNLEQYFLFPEIGFNPKSESIGKIRENLNIGIDSILFIDDQQYELDEVKYTYPEVSCLHVDDYKELINNDQLIPDIITEDSKRRRLLYIEDSKRKKDELEYKHAPEEFVKSLNIEVSIYEPSENDLERAVELTERTNQLNTTGRPYSFDELNGFRKSESHRVLMCEMKDKYGSYGKIGVALIEENEISLSIEFFLMSCRVASRGIGSVFLTYIMKCASYENKKLYAKFYKNDRNKLMHFTYKIAGFNEIEKNGNEIRLENPLNAIQDYPKYMNLNINN